MNAIPQHKTSVYRQSLVQRSQDFPELLLSQHFRTPHRTVAEVSGPQTMWPDRYLRRTTSIPTVLLFASLCIERLGHSTIAVTIDLYSHVTPGLQEAAALRFEDALQVKAEEPQSVPETVPV